MLVVTEAGEGIAQKRGNNENNETSWQRLQYWKLKKSPYPSIKREGHKWWKKANQDERWETRQGCNGPCLLKTKALFPDCWKCWKLCFDDRGGAILTLPRVQQYQPLGFYFFSTITCVITLIVCYNTDCYNIAWSHVSCHHLGFTRPPSNVITHVIVHVNYFSRSRVTCAFNRKVMYILCTHKHLMIVEVQHICKILAQQCCTRSKKDPTGFTQYQSWLLLYVPIV